MSQKAWFVLAIFALLVVSVPSYFYVSEKWEVLTFRKKLEANAYAKADIQKAISAMDKYYRKYDSYTANVEDLEEEGFWPSAQVIFNIVEIAHHYYRLRAYHRNGDEVYHYEGPATYMTISSTKRTGYELPVLTHVAVDKFTKIEISKIDRSPVLLERKEEGWLILPERSLADQGKVMDMLNILSTLTLSALISNSGKYDRYGLGKTDRINVKAWIGDVLKRDFEIGKEAPSFQHTFVKIRGDRRVFQTRGNLKPRFDQTVDDLLDKALP